MIYFFYCGAMKKYQLTVISFSYFLKIFLSDFFKCLVTVLIGFPITSTFLYIVSFPKSFDVACTSIAGSDIIHQVPKNLL